MQTSGSQHWTHQAESHGVELTKFPHWTGQRGDIEHLMILTRENPEVDLLLKEKVQIVLISQELCSVGKEKH